MTVVYTNKADAAFNRLIRELEMLDRLGSSAHFYDKKPGVIELHPTCTVGCVTKLATTDDGIVICTRCGNKVVYR